MLPIFVFFLFAFAKIFALLILVQKVEIASYYAARRWQLESHRNVEFEGSDSGALLADITDRVRDYVGYNNASVAKFLDLQNSCRDGSVTGVTVQRTQVWNV